MGTHNIIHCHRYKEFHGSFRGTKLPIDQARRPSTMAENCRFMNFFTYVNSVAVFELNRTI